MDYTITIDGESFTGNVTKLLSTAVGSVKTYVIDAYRTLISGDKFSDKWVLARRFLAEYFELAKFTKKATSGKYHPALDDLSESLKYEGEEILKYLDKRKTPAIASIARQIRGKSDASDIMDIFLGDVADVEEDDEWDD